jgi:hypothetical protein
VRSSALEVFASPFPHTSFPFELASSTPHRLIRVKDFFLRKGVEPVVHAWRLPSQETPETAVASGTYGMTALPAYACPDAQFCDTRRQAGTDAENHDAGGT